jgi:tRNA dimethylallyltransferase
MTTRGLAVALVGPTASGKSALAHACALERAGDVEILSVDAMSVYQGMDIGTAKPSATEQSEVAYHLIDLVAPSEEFTVAQFQREAKSATETIWQEGHGALFVGGTGLYGRAVIDELDIPARYPEIHSELEVRAKDGLTDLYAELQRLDPLAASRCEATNARRIVRALEVTLGSGRPFSSYGEGLLTYGPIRVVQIGLDVDVDILNERIERRFRQWMDEGLLEEVTRLANDEGGMSRTARQAVGYRELLRHVEDGESLEQCVLDAIAHSRQLGRRQRAWFRRDHRIEWFVDHDDAARRLHEVLSGANGFVKD